MIRGLTKTESTRTRCDTLIEVLRDIRPCGGRLQVFVIRELQKVLVDVVDDRPAREREKKVKCGENTKCKEKVGVVKKFLFTLDPKGE